jgi:hypothetical protein
VGRGRASCETSLSRLHTSARPHGCATRHAEAGRGAVGGSRAADRHAKRGGGGGHREAGGGQHETGAAGGGAGRALPRRRAPLPRTGLL